MVQRLGHPSVKKAFSTGDFLIQKGRKYVVFASDIKNDVSKIAIPTISFLALDHTFKESSHLLAVNPAEFIVAVIFVTIQFIGLTAVVLHAAKPIKTLQNRDFYKELDFWDRACD